MSGFRFRNQSEETIVSTGVYFEKRNGSFSLSNRRRSEGSLIGKVTSVFVNM